MAAPSYQELESRIDECMLADRFRMRRDLKKKKERARLTQAIEKSRDLAERRRTGRPDISFPEILPVSQHVDAIKAMLAKHQVLIVAGETGSGKTTQLPKICLDAGRGVFGTIGHTQPRRVAARTIAQRLSHELQVKSGNEVGYQVRFQDQTSKTTLIKVMTDGVLLAETQNDRFLERYDTLIIDEAHERSLNIDFLLGYIKRILPKRPDLKVIITSATIDVERFSKHFGNAPIIEVSGRTYPVDVQYRPLSESSEDTDERMMAGIVEALNEIDSLPKGDVLVFLPGEREIRETAQYIKRKGPAGFELLPLYSRLAVADQDRVFNHDPEQRRIVLATNVAETSLTVPGIRYVIDPGLARISRYSFRSRVQQLPVEPVSQASADQRKGRCGRVSEGVCYRLYSEADFEGRPEFTDPEILRTNLASVILQMLQLKLGDISRFPFVERPNQKQINDGYTLLFELGAVSAKRQITRMGKQLARFPVDLRFARMLVAAGQFGCLHELLIVTSALTIADPRERPFDHQQAADEKHRELWDEKSDFLSLTRLWEIFEAKRQELSQGQLRKYCRQQFLSYPRMREWREIHRQLLLVAKDMGLRENQKPADYAQIHRAMLTGLLGHVSFRSGEHEYQGARNRKQYIFPGSSQFNRKPKWIMASEVVETSRLYARTVAAIENRWIEPIASHLVQRTFHDPFFDEKLGQVMAREEVTLYGMVIVANRLVDYGAVQAYEARELFIQQGLVEGRLKTQLKFFQKNRRLIREIEQMESKVRRRDILVEARALYDFYDQALPADVTSELQLRQFVTSSTSNAVALELTKDELMKREAQLSDVLYPEKLELGGSALPLNYKFEPGTGDDGVTVDVPLVLLGQVPSAQLDWIVPGLLKEKCLALIRSLPKSIRRNFVPAPEYVERVLQDFEYDGRELTDALADRLFRLSGNRVEASDFQVESLDDHLTINVRVTDERGKAVANGRNIRALRESLGSEISEKLQSRQPHEIERKGITSWDFGDLPESVEVRQGKLSVRLYPALIDRGTSVDLKLIENREQAERSSEAGLQRLLMIQLKDQVKYLEKNIPGFSEFSLYFATRGSRAELSENLVRSVFYHVFLEDQPLVRTAEEFEKRTGERSRLFEQMQQVARITGSVLKQSMAIQGQLKERSIEPAASDISGQIDRLVGGGFPQGVPFAWLRHYPRYFRGITHRLERLAGATRHDEEAVREIRHWEKLYLDASEADQEALQKYRWMLEEFRISLFAQSIGTTMPVSGKRLEKEWQRVMGLRQ